MFTVNLPKPSQALIDAVYTDLNNKLENHTFMWDLDNMRESWSVGTVENIWGFDITQELGKQEFQHFFDEKIHVCGMMFAPDPRAKISCLPPHTDAGRMLGINYLLEAGGDNVTTTTYKKIIDSDVPVGNYFARYEDMIIDNSRKLDLHTWYGLDGLQYHSVENIIRNRIFLTITVENTSATQFINRYQHMITNLDIP